MSEEHRQVTNTDLQTQLNVTQTAVEAVRVQNNQQTERLVSLETKFADLPAHIKEIASVKSQISHYTGAVAGAIGVLTILGGVVAWIAQESITTTFSEIREMTTAVTNLQRDVAIIQFQLSQREPHNDQPVDRKSP
jgi:predicted small integral membrane protein